jgi:hypothetical protein
MKNKQQKIETRSDLFLKKEGSYSNVVRRYFENLPKPDGRPDRQIERESTYEKIFELYDTLLLNEDYPSKSARIRAVARTLNIQTGLIWAAMWWCENGCPNRSYRTIYRKY